MKLDRKTIVLCEMSFMAGWEACKIEMEERMKVKNYSAYLEKKNDFLERFLGKLTKGKI